MRDWQGCSSLTKCCKPWLVTLAHFSNKNTWERHLSSKNCSQNLSEGFPEGSVCCWKPHWEKNPDQWDWEQLQATTAIHVAHFPIVWLLKCKYLQLQILHLRSPNKIKLPAADGHGRWRKCPWRKNERTHISNASAFLIVISDSFHAAFIVLDDANCTFPVLPSGSRFVHWLCPGCSRLWHAATIPDPCLPSSCSC